MLLAVVPANALLQRRDSKEVGQVPDGEGAPPPEHTGRHKKSAVERNWTLGEAVCSFPFWSVTIGHFALGTALFMINTHIVARLVSVGLDKLAAAFVAGLIGFVRIGGTLVWGFVSDKIGRRSAYGVAIVVTLVGLACLINLIPTSSMAFVYFSAVLYSIGHSAGNPTYGSVIADVFSGRKAA